MIGQTNINEYKVSTHFIININLSFYTSNLTFAKYHCQFMAFTFHHCQISA